MLTIHNIDTIKNKYIPYTRKYISGIYFTPGVVRPASYIFTIKDGLKYGLIDEIIIEREILTSGIYPYSTQMKAEYFNAVCKRNDYDVPFATFILRSELESPNKFLETLSKKMYKH